MLNQNNIQRSFATLAATSFFSSAHLEAQSNPTNSTPSPLSTPSGLNSQTSAPAKSKLVNLQADNRLFFLDLDGKKNVPVIVKQISVDSTDRIEAINFLRQDNGEAGTLKTKDISRLNREEIQRVYLENIKKSGLGIAPSTFPPNREMVPVYFGVNGISLRGSYKDREFKPFDHPIISAHINSTGTIKYVLMGTRVTRWEGIDEIGQKNISTALESARSKQWYSGDGREKAWTKFNELMDSIENTIRESAKANKIALDPEVSRLLARQNRKELSVEKLSALPKAALLNDFNRFRELKLLIAVLKSDEEKWKFADKKLDSFGYSKEDEWIRKLSFQESVDLMGRWRTVLFR